MKSKITTNRVGFTIVELLIVIVVIAILASIAIVAYRGIQDNARNSRTISLVNQWDTVLKLYNAKNDTYPTSAADYVCLGDDFPAETPYVEGQCMISGGWGVSVDPSFMSNVRTVTGSNISPAPLHSFSFADLNDEMQHYRGVLYLNRNNGAAITYLLKGGADACVNNESYFAQDGYVVCARILHGNPFS